MPWPEEEGDGATGEKEEYKLNIESCMTLTRVDAHALQNNVSSHSSAWRT